MEQGKIYKKNLDRVRLKIVPPIYVKYILWGNFLFFISLFLCIILLNYFSQSDIKHLDILIAIDAILFSFFLALSFVFFLYYKTPYTGQWKKKFGILD